MQQMIRYWLGHDRPKQYCAFAGGRSMLQHTLARLTSVVPEEQTVTIIASGHRRFLDTAGCSAVPGKLIEQPANCGTAAGIFLTATYIIDRDPEAVLVILPSDHFINPRERFQQHLQYANLIVQQHPDHLILFGAEPDGPEPDYGWIVPGDHIQTTVSHRFVADPLHVVRFREKPCPAEAATLYHSGALWNTMIVAVRVQTLWELGWLLLPELTSRFDTLRRVVRAAREGKISRQREQHALQQVYQQLEPADFSRDILQQATGSTLVLPMDGIEWSDWGRPERVAETLHRIGKQPAFPVDLIKGSGCPYFSPQKAPNFDGVKAI